MRDTTSVFLAVLIVQACVGINIASFQDFGSALAHPDVRLITLCIKLGTSLILVSFDKDFNLGPIEKLCGLKESRSVLGTAMLRVIVNEMFIGNLSKSGSHLVYLIYALKSLVLPGVGYLVFERHLSPKQTMGALMLFFGVFLLQKQGFQTLPTHMTDAFWCLLTLIVSCISSWSTGLLARESESIHGLNTVLSGLELLFSLPYLMFSQHTNDPVFDLHLLNQVGLSALLGLLQTLLLNIESPVSLLYCQSVSLAIVFVFAPLFGAVVGLHVYLSVFSILCGATYYYLSTVYEPAIALKDGIEFHEKKPTHVLPKRLVHLSIGLYVLLPFCLQQPKALQSVGPFEDSLPFLPFYQPPEQNPLDNLPSHYPRPRKDFVPLKGPQVALVTYYAPQKNRAFHIWVDDKIYVEQVKAALKLMADYTIYHNMAFFFRHRFMVDTEKESAYWGKMQVVEKYLKSGYKWVIWTDVDVVFMHDQSIIEKWLDKAEQKGYDVALVGECIKQSPAKHGTVRSGFFAIRSSEKGLQFLNHWKEEAAGTSYDQFPLEGMMQQSPWKEMAYVANPDGIHTYPQCYERYDGKAISVHFAGWENKRKVPGYASNSVFSRKLDLEIVAP
ncbi:hypothetical protein EDD86DRAFT_88725 [Gorgonomyces haynaldii]|nr:hypothetical protein EDD86DRAFT_88725 [Gorgonomyces haynaldii]